MATARFLQLRAPAWRNLALLALLLPVLALVASLPVRAEHPTAFMQRVANELINAQKLGGGQAFATVLRKYADVPWIGMSSLGNYAQRMPAAERPNYFNGMVKFVSNYAAKEAGKYPVKRATITSATQENAQGVYVDSVVELSSGETYDVRWFLGRSGGTYKVRDAQVVGFWMSPFLKNLFENYITENGGNPQALVVALNR